MSQVSKRLVHKSIEIKMYETLWEAISQLKSKTDVQSFINDLLSPPERTMVAKRLAIATLLSRNYNYETIMNVLKVSSTTISKVSLLLNQNNGYKTAINKIARAEATREFWQDVENLLFRLGTPKYTFAEEGSVKKKLGHSKKTLL